MRSGTNCSIRSMHVDFRLNMVSSWMHHSSHQIPVTPRQRKHKVILPVPDDHGTVPGQKKGMNSHLEYKLHTIITREYQLVRAQVTTTASVHDSRIDLSQSEKTMFLDKGYLGVKPIASKDKTMHRTVRNHPLSIKEKRRNRVISRVRSLVERT
ncbi:transposase [Methanosphaerula palustris]|uniref:transposase n=1 Tax=Methanosphaerula palustris TaxID=475088 RepID=UPI0001848F64